MIQGWDKLQKQLNAIANADYTPALEKGVREAILPEMQERTPVRTGDLLASEEVRVENNTVSLNAGGGKVDYAAEVEFGTVSREARPYMRPAIDTKSNEAMKIAAKETEKIMKGAI